MAQRMPGLSTRSRLGAAALGLMLAAAGHAQDDMEDVLGGFDDLDTYSEVVQLDKNATRFDQKMWDPSGSLSLASSYNLKNHRSTTGTDYDGLSKLRLRLNLGLDGQFGEHWRSSLNLSAWRDFAYALRDADYTDEVIDEYEQVLDVQDAWVSTRLGPNWDSKLGRQVAVWGFADNLRVLDVLNPLDNLEPGLADIEDLRLPVGMLRLDRYAGPWQASAILVGEQRFSRNPPLGSDFYSVTDGQGNAVSYREIQPEDFEELNYAAALTGRFSGWDLSLTASRRWFDEPYLDARAFDSSDPNATQADFERDAVLRHSRVNQWGYGVQITQGGWLFKHEAALIDGLQLTSSQLTEDPLPLLNAVPIVNALFPDGAQLLPTDVREVRRYDMLLGVEYFGLAQTTLSLEMAARHIDDFDQDLAWSGYLKWRGETALRITRDFLNERLRLHLISVLFSRDGQMFEPSGGAIHRINGEYDFGQGLVLLGGVVIYQGGNQAPFTISQDNDRLFAEMRWSF